MIRSIFIKICGVLLVVMAALLMLVKYGSWRANRLVDEGNVALAAANELAEKGQDECDILYTEEMIAGFPGNRQEHTAQAQLVLDLFDRGAAQYKEAAAKYNAASQQAINNVPRDYFTLKSQAAARLADWIQKRAEVVRLLLDPAINDFPTLNEQSKPLLAEIEQLFKESQEKDEKARVLFEQHRSDFE